MTAATIYEPTAIECRGCRTRYTPGEASAVAHQRTHAGARAWTAAAILDRSKTELTGLVQAAVIPTTLSDLDEAHDYIDANGLGGWFDDDAPAISDADYERGEDAPYADATDLANAVNHELNAWIVAGGLRA